MKVTLRIVGLYFSKPVTIDNAPDTVVTIKDVIEAYQRLAGGSAQPEGLDYVSEPIKEETPYYNPAARSYEEPNVPNPPQSMLGFTYHNSVPQKTLSGIKRDIGIYSLFENYQEHSKVSISWQSYVLGKDGRNRTATKIGEGFKYFNQTPVQDGDTIVWRMVAICREPNFPPVTELQ